MLVLESTHYGGRQLRQAGAHGHDGQTNDEVTDPHRMSDGDRSPNQQLGAAQQAQAAHDNPEAGPGHAQVGRNLVGEFLADGIMRGFLLYANAGHPE